MDHDQAKALRKRTLAFCKRRGRGDDAEDLTHDILIAQLEGKHDERTKLAWQLAHALKRRYGDMSTQTHDLRINEELFPIEINEIHQMEAPEHKRNLDFKKMLELLPSHMRAILNLLFVYEFELKEIAEIFGQHPTTIKNIYRRAERILRHEEALPDKRELRDWWKNP